MKRFKQEGYFCQQKSGAGGYNICSFVCAQLMSTSYCFIACQLVCKLLQTQFSFSNRNKKDLEVSSMTFQLSSAC